MFSMGLLLFIGQIGFAESIMDMGMATTIYQERKRHVGRVTMSGDLYNPATWREVIEKYPQTYTNAKRMFSLDEKGFMFIGENLLEGLAFEPGLGDLIVNHRVVVGGRIYSPTITKLENKIERLEEIVTQLKSRLARLENR